MEKFKTDYKIGDIVYCPIHKKGKVTNIHTDRDYPIEVTFDRGTIVGYTSKGYYYSDTNCRWDKELRLSFTPYKLEGGTFERPINPKDWIGKWGLVNDTYVAILKDYIEGADFPYIIKFLGESFNETQHHFTPLPHGFQDFLSKIQEYIEQFK